MGIISGIGKTILFGLGLILFIGGILLTMTVLGAIIGLPLALFGVILIAISLRSGERSEQKIIVTQQVGERQSASLEEKEDKKPKGKFCSECGASIKKTDKFCAGCGVKVK